MKRMYKFGWVVAAITIAAGAHLYTKAENLQKSQVEAVDCLDKAKQDSNEIKRCINDLENRLK